MNCDNFKIIESDISTHGVVAAPDRLSGTAQENKAVFDRLIKTVVAQKFNSFIEQVAAEIENIEVPPKGEPGEPGYTPQKGVDYWTEEDRTAVIDEVVRLLTPPSLTGFSVLEGKNVTTIINTLSDGSTETIAIAFNEQGKPVSISVDGVEIPGAWTEV